MIFDLGASRYLMPYLFIILILKNKIFLQFYVKVGFKLSVQTKRRK